MKYPHSLFLSYLFVKGADSIGVHCPEGMPICVSSEIAPEGGFPPPGTKQAEEWIKQQDLENLSSRVRIAYSIWHDNLSRYLTYIYLIRGIEEEGLIDSLWKLASWKLTPNDIHLYKKLFFDIDDMTTPDFMEYLTRFPNDVADTVFIENALNRDVPLNTLLSELGITQAPPKNMEILSRFLNKAAVEFDKSTGKDAMYWGKFALSVMKRLEKEGKEDPQAILKELKLELGKPDIVHEIDDLEIV